MNVKLVQRIEVEFACLFSLWNCVANVYCYFSTCINTTTQVQYHIMFNIKIYFCYNEFFVKNIFSVH